MTLLIMACLQNDREDIIDYLLSIGADVNVPDSCKQKTVTNSSMRRLCIH
jgi:ankyrin repeat protein